MNFLRDLDVLVLGLGHSGLAMARWCARHGARVTAWDSRESAPGAAALAQEFPDVRQIGGVLGVDRLAGVQLVLRSPGLAPRDALVAPLLEEAAATGIAVLGELGLFVRALADLQHARGYAPQILAITGTNGKTTTAALTALLVERAGRSVALAGNIGPTLLDTLAERMATLAPVAEAVLTDDVETANDASDAGDEVDVGDEVDAVETDADGADEPAETDEADVADDAGDAIALAAPLAAEMHGAPAAQAAPDHGDLPEVWVLELSSFQLDGVRGFEPAAATVLNLTQDHLDWHGSMAAYTAAKSRVFGNAAVMVINRDDALVEALVPAPSVLKGKARPADRKVLRFGLDAPRRPGDFGLVIENGMAWLVRALPADETVKRKKGEEEEIHLQRLMPADALRIRGRHNAANALAALALATAIGCALAPMLHGLRDYRGEPHRLQFVARIDEVEAYDDSKGTNVGATVAALLGLGADRAPARLLPILGGDGKGQDFGPLAAPLAQHARAVATIGRDAAAIEAVLGTLRFQRHDTLEAAVAWCFEQAQPGDAVLLSPACASLDMFRNYGHRAEVFVQAVQALATERGQA